MPLIHHPLTKEELEVSEQAAEILTTNPRVPWILGPLPTPRLTAPKPTAATPVPVGDVPTPSEEE